MSQVNVQELLAGMSYDQVMELASLAAKQAGKVLKIKEPKKPKDSSDVAVKTLGPDGVKDIKDFMMAYASKLVKHQGDENGTRVKGTRLNVSLDLGFGINAEPRVDVTVVPTHNYERTFCGGKKAPKA